MKNDFEILGSETVIKLQGGHFTFINTDDLNKVKEFPNKWYAQKHDNKYYVFSKMKRASISLHRWITECPQGKVVDHINGNPLDNRTSNLRIVTSAENMQNRVGACSNSKSGVRGVFWHKQGQKWRAVVKLNGKQHYVGSFDDLTDAEKAVIKARKNIMQYS